MRQVAAESNEGNPGTKRDKNLRGLVFLGIGLLLAVLVSSWLVWEKIGNLESGLARVETQKLALEQELENSQREASDAHVKAQSERARADEAEEMVQQSTRERRRAELEREMAREMADRLRVESERAIAEAERSRQEAERLRKRREKELDRMHEALSRIAESQRTPMGMVVNLGQDSFLFDFDKAALRAENREILSRIAGVLLASHGYRLYVYGHTDDTGPETYNQQLSEKRAQAVRAYLVETGIPAEIIHAQGFGEFSPAVRLKTRQARQRNRRVVIGVVDTVIDYAGAMDK